MSNRFITGVLGFAVLAGSSAPHAAGVPAAADVQTAQTPPPAQQQPVPAQPAQPAISYSGDTGMMFNVIKAASVADFEMVLGKLKEALQKSEDPQRKQQAASWKVFKASEAAPDGTVLYIFFFENAVKGAEYDPVKILSEAFPTEVNALYDKLKTAYATLNSASFMKLMDMSATGMKQIH